MILSSPSQIPNKTVGTTWCKVNMWKELGVPAAHVIPCSVLEPMVAPHSPINPIISKLEPSWSRDNLSYCTLLLLGGRQGSHGHLTAQFWPSFWAFAWPPFLSSLLELPPPSSLQVTLVCLTTSKEGSFSFFHFFPFNFVSPLSVSSNLVQVHLTLVV